MKKITDNLVKMLPYLLVNGLLFASARFLITDTGFGIFMLLFICPLIIFISSIIYGKFNKFNLLYGILIGLIILGLSLTLYSPDLYFYAVIYMIVAFIGNLIGTTLNKSVHQTNKHLSIFKKIVLWIMMIVIGTILTAIACLYLLNIFIINGYNKKLETGKINLITTEDFVRDFFPKNTVWFTITNLSEKNLEKIRIATNEEGKCGLVSDTIKKLTTDETKTLMLDFTQQKKLNCNMPSEGNYILTWKKNGTVNSHGFGYFTNAMPTTTYLTIVFDRNGEIRISRKGSDVEGKELENKKEGEDMGDVSTHSNIVNFDDKINIESIYQLSSNACGKGNIFLQQKDKKMLIFTSKGRNEDDFPFCSPKIRKIDETHAKIYICYASGGGSGECKAAVFSYNIKNNTWNFIGNSTRLLMKDNAILNEWDIPEIEKLFAYMKKQGYNYTIQNTEVFGDYEIK